MSAIPAYSEKQRKILHVLTGFACNNNCLFCCEDDREGRRRHITEQVGRIPAMMEATHDAGQVLFTCGEPTLNPDLPAYVERAARAGIPKIGVITNGRMFAYSSYAERLLDAGLNHATVSLHAADSRLHDALVRTKGAFQQTVAGLRNLARLRERYPLELETSTVVLRRNLKSLASIHVLVSPWGVSKAIFNVMMPEGRGLTHLTRLMPRYAEAAGVMEAWIRELPQEEQRKLAVLDMPYCTSKALPDVIRGHVEAFVQYEPIHPAGPGGVGGGGAETQGASIMSSVWIAGEVFHVTSRKLKERPRRTKRTECRTCRHDGICPGVWKAYVDRFGWEEFDPCSSPGAEPKSRSLGREA